MEDSSTLITYRYVRLAMVALVFGIGISLLEQRLDAHHFQGSISSYYYTPARGMFVAALFAIGVALICVRGGTVLEDALLNVAGMLAMVVAVVPTPPNSGSASIDTLRAERLAAIQNNFPALLWIGVFVVAVWLVMWLANHRAGTPLISSSFGQAVRASAIVSSALLLAAYLWYRIWQHGFFAWAHITAAVSMFAMIAAVAVSDGIRTERQPATRTRGWCYIGIGAAMALGGGGIFIANKIHSWDQAMLDAEALLITLFAVFWAAQTVDLWNYTNRTQAIADRASTDRTPRRTG